MEDIQGILKEYISAFIQALFVLIGLYILFWPMSIFGSSMEDTFYENDRVVMSRLLSGLGLIDQGDIVICKVEIEGKTNDIIKRVIGVPGDVIEIKEGLVFVNEVLLIEDYVNDSMTFGDMNISLADGEYFVLGDNRSASYDSRQFGALQKNKIAGKVILKWYPLKNIKIY